MIRAFRQSKRAVTLVEILVSAGLLGLVMTAVISFYVQAISVSARRDDQSQRLRRFHIGLDKIEQMLREGRLIQVRSRSILFLKLDDESEVNGFPHYEQEAAQIASTKEGVLLVQGGKQKNILPTEAGEDIIFKQVQIAPRIDRGGIRASDLVINIALHYSGNGERSELFFHRSINLQAY